MNQRVKNAKNASWSFLYKHLNINKDFKNYIYQNIFKHFVWKTKKKIWIFRKKIKYVERMFFMNFKLKKKFICDCCWIMSRKSVRFTICERSMFKSRTSSMKSSNDKLWIRSKTFIYILILQTMTTNDTLSWRKLLNLKRRWCLKNWWWLFFWNARLKNR